MTLTLNFLQDPYEITDDVDVKNPDSFQCSKSFVPTVERCESELTNPSRKSSCAGSQSDGENDRGFDLLASVPSSRLVNERSPSHSSKLLSTHFYFRYPVELPPFSSKVMKAFETNTIDSEWQTLLDELTRWILAKKKFSICKRESQAIGQSLYSKYPMIGRDGYRPWSYLCTCIAANLRKEKKRRGLSIIFPASWTNERRKNTFFCSLSKSSFHYWSRLRESKTFVFDSDTKSEPDGRNSTFPVPFH